MNLDPTIVATLLRYEPDTGKLFWRHRAREHFVSDKGFACWNGKHADQEAFTANENGYRRGRLLGQYLKAHRVIWAMTHGEWPEHIDHINGDRADNRLINLRAVSRVENHRNMKRSTRNTSGRVGVLPFRGRWQAQITVNYRTVHLGTFETFDDAAAARASAERVHGFHKNHGRATPSV